MSEGEWENTCQCHVMQGREEERLQREKVAKEQLERQNQEDRKARIKKEIMPNENYEVRK